MATNVNTIKNWFKTGLKPTQAQFWAWMDSFWHKDELIPTNKVDGLETALNSKASAAQLATKVDKEEGKSLLLDTEIQRLATLQNQDVSGKANLSGDTFTGEVSAPVFKGNVLIGALTQLANALFTLFKQSTNVTGQDVAAFVDVNRNPTATSTATSFGFVARVQSNGSFNENIVYGSQFVGRKLGTGNIIGLYGSDDIAEHRGSGNIDFLIATTGDAKMTGTGTGVVGYARGISNDVRINNPNITVNYAQGIHQSVGLDNGTVGDLTVIYLDVDHEPSNPSTTKVTGDLSYIQSGNDVLPEVEGNAYFIKSLTQLPSLFSGKIVAPFFEGNGSLLTGLNSAQLTDVTAFVKKVDLPYEIVENDLKTTTNTTSPELLRSYVLENLTTFKKIEFSGLFTKSTATNNAVIIVDLLNQTLGTATSLMSLAAPSLTFAFMKKNIYINDGTLYWSFPTSTTDFSTSPTATSQLTLNPEHSYTLRLRASSGADNTLTNVGFELKLMK